MKASSGNQAYVTTVPEHIIDLLVTEAVEQNATDIHVQVGHALAMRIGGRLRRATTSLWDTEHVPLDVFASMLATLGLEPGDIGYAVRRYSGQNERRQVRATYFPNFDGDKLILRVQNLSPSPFHTMVPFPSIADNMRMARGLILVTGAIGSGKTTLAAAIAHLWAQNDRHVMTLEDPVEYLLYSQTANVTHINCTLTDSSRSYAELRALSFADALALALRSDIQGLMIGETRTPETFRCALEFAAAREPVVTTMHAGGLADAIIRATTMARQTLGADVARTVLSQTLHSIFDVRMGWTADGTPCPMVSLLPIHAHDRLRRLVAEFNPETLREQVRQEMSAGESDEFFITEEAAIEAARNRGCIRIEGRY